MTATNQGPKPGQRVKVAILGGGAGGLSAAWALSDPERRAEFEITVYQMGWRLGGKGASGRNLERGKRIEEHGLHMWFGFYENAFRVMRACYEEWRKLRPESPIQSCLGEAFLPHRNYVLNECLPDKSFSRWALDLPDGKHVPGDGRRVRFADSLAFSKLSDLVKAATAFEKAGPPLPDTESVAPPVPPSPLPLPWPVGDYERTLLTRIRQRYLPIEESVPGAPADTNVPVATSTLLQAAQEILAGGAPAQQLIPPARADVEGVPIEEGIADSLRKVRFRTAIAAASVCFRWAREALRVAHQLAPGDETLRRLWMSVDFAAALASGLSDDIFSKRKKFKDLDEEDLNGWLIRHGADAKLVRANPIVRFAYSVVFAFEDGNSEKPLLAAGSALQGLLRLFLTYKGALAYRMAAGMGDIVFSPFYEALVARGVKFEFFHRVEDVVLAPADGVGSTPVVQEIKLTRQLQLKKPALGYQPLIDVAKFPCWPNQPNWAQITRGKELRALVDSGEVNLEAPREHAGKWRDEKTVTLTRAQFDQVILAIPVGALPGITSGFAGHGAFGERWQEMVNGVGTIPTQAMQLWLESDLVTLGGAENAPVWGTYVEPLDTYADMSPALKLEECDPAVKQLAYFCGALHFSGQDHKKALEQVRKTGRALITDHAHGFWPQLGKGLDVRWNQLHSLGGAAAARSAGKPDQSFEHQYFRANILPSERFSASFPGTTRHRLPPGLPQVSNLFLAGDWTDNVLNVGCVEATVISGLMAARALAADEGILVAGVADDYLWLGADPDEEEAPAVPPPSPGPLEEHHLTVAAPRNTI